MRENVVNRKRKLTARISAATLISTRVKDPCPEARQHSGLALVLGSNGQMLRRRNER
jgi:hypothetical protein